MATTGTTRAGTGSDIAHIALAILAAAVLLCWPAFYNGYPLVYADSASYIDTIDPRKAHPARPVFYALFLRLFHWHAWLWPAILAQALIVAHLIYLVLRVHCPALRAETYLLAMCTLAAATPLPWLTSLIMPDALTSVVALGLFLLGFAGERLERGEQWYLMALCAGAIASHLSHLPLAVALVLTILAYRVFAIRPRGVVRGGSPWMLIGPVAVAIAAHLAVNAISTGRIVLAPSAPVDLLARSIADGPALAYLRDACPERMYVLCDRLDALDSDRDRLLWPAGEAPLQAYDATLRAEAGTILVETLKAYPTWQLGESAGNALRQLVTFGLGDILSYGQALPAAAVTEYIQAFFPGAYADYVASPQFTGRIPARSIDLWHMFFVWVGGVAGVFLALEFARRRDGLPLALLVVVVATLVFNAAITGALASVQERYQGRVIWLVVFFAVLGALRYAEDASDNA